MNPAQGSKKLWKVVFRKRALKALQKMDSGTHNRITSWIRENVEGALNPKDRGKGLSSALRGLWRYRVGDYRIVCRIEEEVVTVVVVHVGHRSSVYKDFHL